MKPTTQRDKRRRLQIGAVISGFAGLATVAAFLTSQIHHPSWNEQADAACLEQFDRQQALPDGIGASALDAWHAQVELADALSDIEVPTTHAFSWRPVVNSSRDLAWIWGLAVHARDHDPIPTLRYYAKAINADLRTFRSASRRLQLSICSSREFYIANKLVLSANLSR